MTTSQGKLPPDYQPILEAISSWPVYYRLAFISDIAQTLMAETVAASPRKKHGLEHALGLLAGDWPAPTDEEVERMLDEARWEKYGQ